VLEQLSTLIEYSDGRASAIFEALIRKLQIQNSRVTTLPLRIANSSSIVTDSNINGLLVDTAEVIAICNQLFPYSRGDVTSIPSATVDLSGFANAIGLMNINGSLQSDLIDIARQRVATTEAKRAQPRRLLWFLKR